MARYVKLWFSGILTEVNALGCSGADTFMVYIGSPQIDSIYGNPSVCPAISGIPYWNFPEEGDTLYWSTSGTPCFVPSTEIPFG